MRARRRFCRRTLPSLAAAQVLARAPLADDGGTQKVDVFKAKGTERSRGGYEDGAVVLFKRATVEEFLQVRSCRSAPYSCSSHTVAER